MSVKDKYSVKKIDSYLCYEWLIFKHYAKRKCPIKYSFGIYNKDNALVGICVYGGSANRNNMRICGYDTVELNRLVINDGLEKNILSFFVSKTLYMLPKPIIVISYADPNNGHHGYIYQATNWIYLGQGQRRDGGVDTGVTSFIKDGKQYHAKSVSKKIGSCSKENAEKNGYTRIFTQPKHKYIYIIANKKQKSEIMSNIGYIKRPYPKGNNVRYDASYKPAIQTELF